MPETAVTDPELKPAMTAEEGEAYLRLAREAHGVVEFGCGGSTLAAVRAGVKLMHSVETDPRWIERCTRHAEISDAIGSGRLKLHHANIGPVGDFGGPTNREFMHMWPNYHHGIWEKIPFVPDFVLVDGRFRVATALQAAVRCRPGARIAVHDYTWRDDYHVLEPFFETAETVETMRIFTVPSAFRTSELVQCLSAYFLVQA